MEEEAHKEAETDELSSEIRILENEIQSCEDKLNGNWLKLVFLQTQNPHQSRYLRPHEDENAVLFNPALRGDEPCRFVGAANTG